MKYEDLQNIVYKDLPVNNCKWWERFLLLFKPTYIFIDPYIEGNDYPAAVHFKTLNGKIFITKDELFISGSYFKTRIEIKND